VRGLIALAVCRVALLWAAGITVLFPVVWIALASVKTPEQLSDPFLLTFFVPGTLLSLAAALMRRPAATAAA